MIAKQRTLKSLNLLDNHMSKGGYIVFDEASKKKWSEGKAMKKFYNINKKKNKMIKIDSFYQPDILLKKIE